MNKPNTYINSKIIDGKKYITISSDFFEHLLNCLANQKFVNEAPPNLDALSLPKSEYNNIQIRNQEAIDKAWRTGMFILQIDFKKNSKFLEKEKILINLWNNSINRISNEIEDYINKYEKDSIEFKWKHIVYQELLMWLRLSCFQNCIIDYENEKYDIGQVSTEDFNYIVNRRGFTEKMAAFSKETLKIIGIGEKL